MIYLHQVKICRKELELICYVKILVYYGNFVMFRSLKSFIFSVSKIESVLPLESGREKHVCALGAVWGQCKSLGSRVPSYVILQSPLTCLHFDQKPLPHLHGCWDCTNCHSSGFSCLPCSSSTL